VKIQIEEEKSAGTIIGEALGFAVLIIIGLIAFAVVTLVIG
jgi:heme/copper-type cytochrome/quinol oxidase subunit 4